MRHHEHLIGSECQVACGALRRKFAGGGLAVECGDVAGIGPASVGMAREQQAQLFKAFADRGNRLGQVGVALCRASLGVAVCRCVSGINAATWKDIRTGREARFH